MRLNAFMAELAALQKSDKNPEIFVKATEVSSIRYDAETNRVQLDVYYGDMSWIGELEIATEPHTTTFSGTKTPPQKSDLLQDGSVQTVQLNLNA